jgi:hypothetical protein
VHSRGNLVRAKLLPPLLVGLPHHLRSWQVELSRPQESEEGGVIVSVVAKSLGCCFAVGRDEVGREQILSERLEGCLLLLVAAASVTGPSTLFGRVRWIGDAQMTRVAGQGVFACGGL